MTTFVTLDNLRTFANSLIEHMSKGELKAVNICPSCGAVMNGMECEYCGTKAKLVVDRKGSKDETDKV